MDTLLNALSNAVRGLLQRYPGLMHRILRNKRLKRWINRKLIERYAGYGAARPRPYSLRLPFTSWSVLTDRTYTGRQLAEDRVVRDRPDVSELMPLFERKTLIESDDTSVLLAHFAQWFTDSFIRTHPETDKEMWRRNTSNHEIDLCQIYGLTEDQTNRLRSGQGGRLKSQTGADGGEYPAQLLAEGTTHDNPVFADPDFDGLFAPDRLRSFTARVDEKDLPTLFATGLEQGNSTPGNVLMNTVFLRAHNHIAGELAAAYPDWDDEQLFQTTRNIMIVLLLKITLHDYIAHIATLDFPFDLDPEVGERMNWKRSNWISIEFGILYRWHSLVPDRLKIGDRDLSIGETLSNPSLVTELGPGAILDAASRQASGRIGLHNTPAMFTQARRMWIDGAQTDQSVQGKTIEMGRRAKLKPYNAYRQAFGLEPLRSFQELTGESETAAKLASLYGSIEDLDWYVGLLAERHDPGAMTGELMTRMVAFDAFTHIFGNPLVSKGVFREETFSPVGWKLIAEIDTFQQIVDRVVDPSGRVAASFKKLDA